MSLPKPNLQPPIQHTYTTHLKEKQQERDIKNRITRALFFPRK